MRVTVVLAPGVGEVPAGATALIIDVLRASTTLTVALSNGATRVLPVAGTDEAFTLKTAQPDALLCGERDGMRIAGFDLGNSPAEYSRSAVADRPLIFASTNGSLAMLGAHRAGRRVLAAFVNASAAVEAVASEREVALVCAGKLGAFSLEDAACAGWLGAKLAERGGRIEGAGARLAVRLAPHSRREVRAVLQGSSHGRYLRSLGETFARDVEFCAGLDRIDRAFEI